MERTVRGKVIRLIRGDLTELAVDGIVNAANAQLSLGGGVAGAIRVKGGPSIQEECNRVGGTFVGGAVITGAGNLKARHVIHAVGPRLGEGNENEKLKKATLNSLKLAGENGLRSIGFPAISTGIFGFPKEKCARIMLSTVRDYLENDETSLEEVIFCLWSKDDLEVFSQTLEAMIPG